MASSAIRDTFSPCSLARRVASTERFRLVGRRNVRSRFLRLSSLDIDKFMRIILRMTSLRAKGSEQPTLLQGQAFSFHPFVVAPDSLGVPLLPPRRFVPTPGF